MPLNRGPKERGRGTAVSTQTRQEAEEAAEAKRKLEQLFGGNPSTNGGNAAPRRNASGRVFSSPRRSTGRQPSDYRIRLERLRMARDPEQIRDATDHFLERHQLPDEVDILFKVLHHPNEKVLREAMGQLSALLMQGRLEGTMLLRERLNDLSGRVAEEATISYIEGLRSQLDALEKG